MSSNTTTSNNRIREYLQSLPTVTVALLLFNIFIHVAIFLTSASIGKYAISVNMVLVRGEYYRMFTSAFVHGGLLHIFMNMSTLVGVGAMLEFSFGSLNLLFVTLWAVPLTSAIYILLNWSFAVLTQQPGNLNNSAVGFSGVLFAYVVIDSFHSQETSRSIFGIFSVPTKAYPLILLVLLSVIVPNISFTGHLAGVIVGLILISKVGVDFLMPSRDCITMMEQSSCLRSIERYSFALFVRNTRDRELLHPNLACTSGGGGGGTRNSICMCDNSNPGIVAVKVILVQVYNVVAAVFYVFGCPVDGLCSSLSHSISLACSTIVNGCTAAIGWVYRRICGSCPCWGGSSGSSSGMGNQYESIPLVDIEQRRTNIERSSAREDTSIADSSTSNTSTTTTTTTGASNKPVKYYRSVHRSNATSGGQPAPSGSATTTTGSGKVIML